MLKKLREKDLVKYERYGKIDLSASGRQTSVGLIRKHRLWETFLYKHMRFTWDEVHEVAEQLEHIRSPKLIEELERFLGFPKTDPHGDPIPDSEGRIVTRPKVLLSSLGKGRRCRLLSVDDGSVAFLKYVSEIGLALSSEIEVVELREFDGSMSIRYDGREQNISQQFAQKVFVELI
jgi:DtxR family Mn-dependent transcriptional regulator